MKTGRAPDEEIFLGRERALLGRKGELKANSARRLYGSAKSPAMAGQDQRPARTEANPSPEARDKISRPVPNPAERDAGQAVRLRRNVQQQLRLGIGDRSVDDLRPFRTAGRRTDASRLADARTGRPAAAGRCQMAQANRGMDLRSKIHRADDEPRAAREISEAARQAMLTPRLDVRGRDISRGLAWELEQAFTDIFQSPAGAEGASRTIARSNNSDAISAPSHSRTRSGAWASNQGGSTPAN